MKYFTFLVLIVFTSCFKGSGNNSDRPAFSRFQSVGQRVQTSLDQINLRENYYNDIFYLNYTAALFPPQGSGIQATNSLVHKGSYLLVTYNTAKDTIRGGVDLISLNEMNLLDTKIFDDMEFSEIVEFNESLEDEPEKVNTDPYGDGWMIKVKFSDASQLEGLMSADDYKTLINA